MNPFTNPALAANYEAGYQGAGLRAVPVGLCGKQLPSFLRLRRWFNLYTRWSKDVSE